VRQVRSAVLGQLYKTVIAQPRAHGADEGLIISTRKTTRQQ
jgi:hypothetical protein